jgi:EpsI family protein
LAVPRKRYWIAVGLLLSVILSRHLNLGWTASSVVESELGGVPYRVGSWQGIDQPMEKHVLDVLGLDAYLNRKYSDARGKTMWLYVGYYGSQRQGKGIHSPKHCYPGAGWSLVKKGVETIPLNTDPGRSIKVNRLVFQKDGVRQVVLYWFQSAGRIVHSEYAQRIYLVTDAILHRRTDGALVKVTAPVMGNFDQLREEQNEFIRQIYPFLQRGLSGKKRL